MMKCDAAKFDLVWRQLSTPQLSPWYDGCDWKLVADAQRIKTWHLENLNSDESFSGELTDVPVNSRWELFPFQTWQKLSIVMSIDNAEQT